MSNTNRESSIANLNNVRLADFEIGERIGRGQFSVVYRARCKSNNQMVALKKVQIYEMTDVKARTDCMKEIQLLQVLSLQCRRIENIEYFITTATAPP